MARLCRTIRAAIETNGESEAPTDIRAEIEERPPQLFQLMEYMVSFKERKSVDNFGRKIVFIFHLDDEDLRGYISDLVVCMLC